jgi:hypothetical protein
VTTIDDAGAHLGLLFGENRQHAKNDWDARIKGYAHQPIGHALGNVLEVHRLALDEHADSDQRVKRPSRGGLRP